MIVRWGNSEDDDVRIAISNMESAVRDLEAVVALPREIGSRVLWANGLKWTRVASNGWWPDSMPYTPELVAKYGLWNSQHIGGDWTLETETNMPTAEEVLAKQATEKALWDRAVNEGGAKT